MSPKAITTRTVFQALTDGALTVRSAAGETLRVAGRLAPDRFAGGDHVLLFKGQAPRPILGNTENDVVLADGPDWTAAPGPGSAVQVAIRLQRPYVDPTRCIGCGVCEHECPVQGLRAVRVTAENESRHPGHRLTSA